MTIDREMKPLKVHKNLVIKLLKDHPEELPNVSSEWDGTAEEFIEALEADPHQWLVDGKLCE